MSKSLYRKSRWLHKMLGIILIPFLIWMSISGIILNHPEQMATLNVPSWMIPAPYKIENWNRSSIIGALPVRGNSVFLYGKKGVWQVTASDSIRFLGNGFPASAFYQKTNHLLLLPYKGDSLLLAATDGGLYFTSLRDLRWHKVNLPTKNEKLKKVLVVENNLVVVGESNLFRTSLANFPGHFSRVTPPRRVAEKRVTLVQLFFDLHDGKVWGLPGRLLMDLMGLIIIFASITGFYVWFWPWRNKKLRNLRIKPQTIQRLRSWNKWHIKIGAIVAIFFLLLGSTGLFLRPPFLVAIAEKTISGRFYPGKLNPNPWEGKIHNALYDSKRHRLVIAAADGIWVGPPESNRPFFKIKLNVPIFVMGPTHFEFTSEGHYRVGSFNGLFEYDPQTDRALDLISGKIAGVVSSVRPSKWMVTGYFELADGSKWMTTHEQGICNLGGQVVHLWDVPQSMNRQHTLSLWNYMFEWHNGRFFKFILSDFYILLIPLGSIAFLLLTLCGLFDWAYRKFRKQPAKRPGIPTTLYVRKFPMEV